MDLERIVERIAGKARTVEALTAVIHTTLSPGYLLVSLRILSEYLTLSGWLSVVVTIMEVTLGVVQIFFLFSFTFIFVISKEKVPTQNPVKETFELYSRFEWTCLLWLCDKLNICTDHPDEE